jgi:UDP-hydrolysing UDP-N-acetyl-D-glucosamine 2-epimerase
MSGPRGVAVVTVSRSDYGHLRPVLDAVREEPALILQLVVAGMHLSATFGLTVREIEADGYAIAARIEMLEADDSPAGVARSIARGTAGFAAAFERLRPDLVLLLGDRFEMLAAAAAALPFALPVVHLHGGEVSEGAMDNQIRHAITKLAHLHLVSAPPHADNVARLGEERWRIHAVGAPGLDRLPALADLDRAEVARRLGLPVDDRWLVVTLHPTTLEYRETAAQADALLAALEEVDAAPVLSYPNADTAGGLIIERLEAFAARRPRARLARNLGDRLYLSLLRHAAAMVGNSSSGLIEAPSFELPVVNVGSRQRGRLRAANVVDVAPEREAIARGLARALSADFRAGLRGLPNPYGDGRAAPRIVRLLRDTPLDARLLQKRLAGEDAA